MTSKQIKIIVASLIGIGILASIFVFGIKKQSEPEVVLIDTLGQEQVEGSDTEITPEEESKVPEDPKTDQASNMVKFSTAMTNAQKAFLDAKYSQSISFYKEALTYKEYDGVYAGLYTSYMVLGDWQKALVSINSAIKLNELNSDYWKWKMLLLDEKMNASYAELKAIYQEGLPRVHSAQTINLVTYFAGIAEANGQKAEAIELWKKAIELNPNATEIYQKEIDRLNK